MATTARKKKAAAPDPFAKAKQAHQPAGPGKSAPETIWRTGDAAPEVAAELGEAVGDFATLTQQAKEMAAKIDNAKLPILAWGCLQFAEHLAAAAEPPPSPMKVVNEQGQSVTFVVQDRTGSTPAYPGQLAELAELLGADVAAGMVRTEGRFSFDPSVLELPGVYPAVAEALRSALAKQVAAAVLTQDQADGLLCYEEQQIFQPDLVKKAAELCGRDRARIEKYLDLLGKGVTRFVKA